jgi:hypothetical protein
MPRLRGGARGIADAAQFDGHAITRALSHDHLPLRIAVASIWRHAAYPAICSKRVSFFSSTRSIRR